MSCSVQIWKIKKCLLAINRRNYVSFQLETELGSAISSQVVVITNAALNHMSYTVSFSAKTRKFEIEIKECRLGEERKKGHEKQVTKSNADKEEVVEYI